MERHARAGRCDGADDRGVSPQASWPAASGLSDFYAYRHAASPTELWKEGEEVSHKEIVNRVNSTGASLIGTPEMAVGYLQLLLDKTGGFGTFLFTATSWADPQTTLRSYELFAREIMPRFDATCETRWPHSS